MVAKLFFAILLSYVFRGRWGGAEVNPKAGAMVAYLFTDRSLGAGSHFVFS
jgi:hypothetical protein